MGNQRTSQAKAPEARQRANTSSSRQRLPSLQDGGYSLLQLHQTIGNRAVGRIIQAKLKVNEPGDEYEREADAVAEMVMRMPEPRYGSPADSSNLDG